MTEMGVEAIIFDHDGTLVPTLERQEAWFKHYAELNNALWIFDDFDEFREIYNRTLDNQGVQAFYDLMGLPCDMKDKSHPVWAEYGAYVQANPVELYDGWDSALPILHEMGSLSQSPTANRRMRMGINTSNTWKNCRSDLLKAGVLDYFDSHITRDALKHYLGEGDVEQIKKPSKVSVSRALTYLGTRASKTIHVVDTLHDLRASQNIVQIYGGVESLITVGVSWGYEKREDLEAGVQMGDTHYSFDHIIDNPHQLVEIVDGYMNP